MISIQNHNWQLIDEQLDTFANNIHILGNCDQLLISRQQIKFDSFSSLFLLAYANIRTYRAALYAFRINLMTANPTLLKKRLPVSLVPKDSLDNILRVVAEEQVQSADRLSLAIPISEILSYYKAELLSDSITVKEGLLMTLSIPLASRQKAFTVYKAYAIPMPQPKPDLALKLKIEAEFLAVSEDQMETAAISHGKLDKCIGSKKYQICHENMATEMGHSSCLANLFFKGTLDALKVCDTEKMSSPVREQAQNLGFGVWLNTSAFDGHSLM